MLSASLPPAALASALPRLARRRRRRKGTAPYVEQSCVANSLHHFAHFCNNFVFLDVLSYSDDVVRCVGLSLSLSLSIAYTQYVLNGTA